ncbi:MAG: hypothetical protein WCO60_18410 [Verrucomicrobiota bacterium]
MKSIRELDARLSLIIGFARGDFAEALLKSAPHAWKTTNKAAPEMKEAAQRFIRSMAKTPAFSPQQQSVRDALAKRLKLARVSGTGGTVAGDSGIEFARGDKAIAMLTKTGGDGMPKSVMDMLRNPASSKVAKTAAARVNRITNGTAMVPGGRPPTAQQFRDGAAKALREDRVNFRR